MFILSFESLQQLHHLLNYIGCQQTAICNEGMFSHIMTTDSWCQTGYAFQFVSGNHNNYSSCKSLLHYRIHFAAHISQNPTPIIWDRQRRVQLINFLELGLTLNYAPELLEPLELDSPIKNVKMQNHGSSLFSDAKFRCKRCWNLIGHKMVAKNKLSIQCSTGKWHGLKVWTLNLQSKTFRLCDATQCVSISFLLFLFILSSLIWCFFSQKKNIITF